MLFCSAGFLCQFTLAQESISVHEAQKGFSFSFGEMFTFFFLMLGPLKILGPFVQMTRKGDANFARRLALRAFAYSCVALLVAAILGENSLRKYHISVPVLAIAAGLILFLVALRTVMQQFDATAEPGPKEYEPELRHAFFPLSFPTIVTPYGLLLLSSAWH